MKKETYTCNHCKKDIVDVGKCQYFLHITKKNIPDELRMVHYRPKSPFEYHFCSVLCLSDAIKEGRVSL